MAKPKQIEITKGELTRRKVSASWIQGDASFDVEDNENPLPSMAKAMAKLPAIVCAINHFPASYADGLRVTSFKMGTKGGAKTIVFYCKKDLDDAAKELPIESAERLLSNPTEEGSYSPPLKKEYAEAVEDVIEEFKKYVLGQRAQGTLPLEGDDDDNDQGETEDSKQEALPGVAAASEARKPAKARK